VKKNTFLYNFSIDVVRPCAGMNALPVRGTSPSIVGGVSCDGGRTTHGRLPCSIQVVCWRAGTNNALMFSVSHETVTVETCAKGKPVVARRAGYSKEPLRKVQGRFDCRASRARAYG